MATTPFTDPNTVHNPATGTSPPASWGDTVRDDLLFLARPPGCVVRRRTSGVQVATTASWVVAAFTDADLRDTDGYHDHTTSPEQVEIPTGFGGWYDINGAVQWAANADGFRTVTLVINGSQLHPGAVAPATSAAYTAMQVQRLLLLNAGDTVELHTWQTSGGDLDITDAYLSVTLRALP